MLFPMFMVFFISALAETNRHPFDLPEGESELVGGFNTEYSSMSFALFFLGEYANMILLSAHDDHPVSRRLAGAVLAFLAFHSVVLSGSRSKSAFCLFMFLWARATLPRYRYDQLMRIGWKFFLPLSLLWVVLTAGYLVVFDKLPEIGNTHDHLPRRIKRLFLYELVARLRADFLLYVQAQGDAELSV